MRRLVVVALVAVLALAGCSSGSAEPSPSASATATPTPSTTPSPTASTTASAELSCDSVLPIARGSAALGIPSDALAGGLDEQTQYAIDSVRDAATENGGMLDCGWYETEGSARITVRIAQDATALFAATEPDVDDGLNALAPVAIGDTGYARCADGEAGSCRAEVLSAGTWVSVSQSPRPDEAAFTTLVTEVVADAQGRLDPPKLATAPDCASVLGADVLASVGLPDATLGSVEGTGTRGSIASATRERAGYLSCSWTSGASSVLVTAAPNGADAWGRLALSSNLFVPLEPADDIGDRALSGCGTLGCSVEVVQGGTWWHIAVSGDATQAAAIARAAIAS